MATRKTTATATANGIGNVLDAIVKIARTINPVNVIDVVRKHNAGYTTAHRNVGRYTGRRVMAFQNACLVANAAWQLDDCQLAALWAMEFPMAVGRVFAINGRMGAPDAAAVRDAIGIVRGVRADYNRTGHGDPSIPNGPKTAIPAFGPSRFDFPELKPAAAPVATAKTGKSKTGKRAA